MTVCTTNRGHGGRERRSSISPTTPSSKAGMIAVKPRSMINVFSSEKKSAPKVTTEIPIAIATPPSYGTGSF